VSVLINVVLPVFVVAGLGAVANHFLGLDKRTLSRVTFYLFAPALIFDSLVTSDVGGAELGQIVAVVLLMTALLWIAGVLAARALRLEGPTQAAFLLAILLMNSGNYGLSVTLFAFDQAGLARALLYFPVTALLSASLGVYLSARGRAPARLALRRMLGVPLLYATALGLILNLLQVSPPEPVQKAIHLLGQASIPTMLVVLGGQLVTTVKDRQANLYLAPMATVVGMRLLLAPALAWAIGWLLGLQGLTLNVVVLESAMPTAVISTILATEFDSDPPFAALAVLLTTLVSIPTVTILLNWLI
jgi:hypothetical protein